MFFVFGQFCLQAQAIPSDSSLLGDLKEIVGEYQGEIRLQNSVGTVDSILVSSSQLHLGIQNDRLVVEAPKGSWGANCQVELGTIREMVKLGRGHAQVLKAVFDYDTTHCPTESKWSALLLFLSRKMDGTLVLETLLTQDPTRLDNPLLPDQDLSVHGFYTKPTDPAKVS